MKKDVHSGPLFFLAPHSIGMAMGIVCNHHFAGYVAR